tara:strand:- start:6664 stop:6987 length:324 start_codon:yes stop_codon:yes gene_type:complete
MKKISLNIRLIFIFLAVLIAPLNAGANLLTDNNKTNFICKFGQDNTTSTDYFLHCDSCVYFFDDINNITHSDYNNVPTLLNLYIELKSHSFATSKFTLVLPRAPPTV